MGLEKEKKEKLEEEGDADDGAKSVESSLRAFCSVTHTHSRSRGELLTKLAYLRQGGREAEERREGHLFNHREEKELEKFCGGTTESE